MMEFPAIFREVGGYNNTRSADLAMYNRMGAFPIQKIAYFNFRTDILPKLIWKCVGVERFFKRMVHMLLLPLITGTLSKVFKAHQRAL